MAPFFSKTPLNKGSLGPFKVAQNLPLATLLNTYIFIEYQLFPISQKKSSLH
jgi:hypothetical protein